MRALTEIAQFGIRFRSLLEPRGFASQSNPALVAQ